jgi:hypothetical protein
MPSRSNLLRDDVSVSLVVLCTVYFLSRRRIELHIESRRAFLARLEQVLVLVGLTGEAHETRTMNQSRMIPSVDI